MQKLPATPSLAASKAPETLANLTFITNPDAWAVEKIIPLAKETAADTSVKQTVHFSRSNLTVDWANDSISLLKLAEQQGLTPDYSCRSGICNSCKSPLLEGEVKYFVQPLEQPRADEVLLCCSRPLGRVVIDL